MAGDFRAAGLAPRAHQVAAVERVALAARAATAQTPARCLVQHAAGSGKSLTVAGLAAALVDGGLRVFVVNDRTQLDEQLFGVCAEVCGARHAVHRVESVDDLRGALASRRGVVFSTLQKFLRLGGAMATGGATAVVVDEAHRSYSNDADGAWAALLGAFGGSLRAVVGLTATPAPRTLRALGSMDESSKLLRPLHCLPLKDAVARGLCLDVLRRFAAPRIEIRILDAHQREASRGARRDVGNVEEHAAVVGAKAAFVAADFRERRYAGGKAMVVARSRRAVVAWTRALRTRLSGVVYGALSGAVDDGRGGAVDEARLNQSSLGAADVIVVCGKLEAGFDEPRLCCLYVDRVIASAARLVQIYSRVNRAAPGKPDRPRVVDFANGAEDAVAAFRKFWTAASAPSWGGDDGRREARRADLGGACYRVLAALDDASGAAGDLDAAGAADAVAARGADAAQRAALACRDALASAEGLECVELPVAFVAELAKRLPAAADDDDAGRRDRPPRAAPAGVTVAVAGFAQTGTLVLDVDRGPRALHVFPAAARPPRPGETLRASVGRAAAACGDLAPVLAAIAADLAGGGAVAALRRLERLDVDDAAAVLASGVGRAANALRKRDGEAAGLAARVVAAMKRNISARAEAARRAAPAAVDGLLEQAGLPAAVAGAVGAALRARCGGDAAKLRGDARGLIADLRRNDALRRRVATGALAPDALLAMAPGDRATDAAKSRRKRPREEAAPAAEDVAGFACPACDSTRCTASVVSLPSTSYGTSEVRDLYFLTCLACRHSWREGD